MEQDCVEIYDKMFPDYPDVLKVSDIQSMLGISRHAVYTLIDNGHLIAIDLGKNYRIPKLSVIDFVLKGMEKSSDTA